VWFVSDTTIWNDNKPDTCFRNITWGLLPSGCQGVMKPIEKNKEKA
jgi:hypothetical protein